MRTKTTKRFPVAICISDLHFTLDKPRSRADQDWKKTQEDYIAEVMHLSMNVRKDGWEVPILIAGDIFNKPDNPAELVNMVIEGFDGANVYMIPGQHDLPYHNKDDTKKSSYGILDHIKTFRTVPHGDLLFATNKMVFSGFPWEHDGYPDDDLLKDELLTNRIKIALLHEYVGMKGRTYDAKDKSLENVNRMSERFKGFDIVICGDNHKHFMYQKNKKSPLIYNCGGFIPRNSDEKGNRSYVGIIYSDKTMSARKMSMNFDDKWVKNVEKEEKVYDTDSLIKTIRKAQTSSIQTLNAFENMVDKISKEGVKIDGPVLKIIKEIMSEMEDE